MADEHLDRLESFRVFIQAIEEGFPVPPVNSDDLKRLHEMSEYVAKEHPGSDGALSIDLMTGVCTPEANVPAVWFRHARLRALARQGVLAAWQRGSKFDDVVSLRSPRRASDSHHRGSRACHSRRCGGEADGQADR